MKILFVVDEFPFPPRNGVTLPTANIIELFIKRGFHVDLLHLVVSDDLVDYGLAKSKGISACALILMRRFEQVRSIIKELIGVSAVFEAWRPDGRIVGDPLLSEYDLVWASPIRPFGLFLKYHEKINIDAAYFMAAINDSYALTLYGLSNKQVGFLAKFTYRMRAHAMRSIEKRMLKAADYIAVQSKREIDYFSCLYAGERAPKLIELKNGVSDYLFQPRQEVEYDLIFVGSLDAFYRSSLDWFVREVYCNLPGPRPSFAIIGRGATEDDILAFNMLSIKYFPYVDDISGFYLKSTILVAPIFKGFGTINKVIEAMAAGCVVIGDHTAFNGIDNFSHLSEGIVAESPSDFVRNINLILGDRELAKRIGGNARDLMRKDFSWDSRFEVLIKSMNFRDNLHMHDF